MTAPQSSRALTIRGTRWQVHENSVLSQQLVFNSNTQNCIGWRQGKAGRQKKHLSPSEQTQPPAFLISTTVISNELFLSAQPTAEPTGPQPVHVQLLRQVFLTPIFQKRN